MTNATAIIVHQELTIIMNFALNYLLNVIAIRFSIRIYDYLNYFFIILLHFFLLQWSLLNLDMNFAFFHLSYEIYSSITKSF